MTTCNFGKIEWVEEIAGGSAVLLVAFNEYFPALLIGGGSVPAFAGFLFPCRNSSDRANTSILPLIFLLVPIVLSVITEGIVRRLHKRHGIYR